METIAITIATQVEAEGFCRPETLLFTRGGESLEDFEQRIFRSLISHHTVQTVKDDRLDFGLNLYISVAGYLDQKWLLEMRRFLKKSFNRSGVPLTDSWVY